MSLLQRSVQQLKKLWSNIKQTQRDALTKEKQTRFATGGGPEAIFADVDPDVVMIAPNLVATAPVLFSPNMKDDKIESNYFCIISNKVNKVNCID